MTESEFIKYWQDSSERSLKTAEDLFDLKYYDWCLFFCHLTLEKILKGLVVKATGKQPLPIHDLEKLAQQAKLKLTQKQVAELNEITAFNIQARYDDIKLSFYKKATKDYTQKFLNKTRKWHQWLESQF